MSDEDDDAVVDPWTVLRRLMAENRTLRRERDALVARVEELELGLRQPKSGHEETPGAPETPTRNRPSLHPPDGSRDPAGTPSSSAGGPGIAAVPAETPHARNVESHLRPWQTEALRAWDAAGRRGVVEAVTGAGKTFVGVAAADEALRAGGRVVVVVPTTELQDQWSRVLLQELSGVDVGRLGAGRQDDLSRCRVLVAIVNSAARRSLRPRPGDLLVADECHRYGAPTFVEALEPGFGHRLGLTATLEREDDGVERYLRSYFGDTVYQLWYDRALSDGVIAPFDIALAGVDLTAEEQREYDAAGDRMATAAWNLSSRHGIAREPYSEFMSEVNRLARGGRNDPAASAARAYLGPMSARRALLAASRRKIDALAALEPAVRLARGALVFTQTKESAESAAELFEEVGIPASALFSGLDRDERRDRMDAFRERAASLLAAPRVLDEGVDVPEADLAVVVAASRSRRQFVQRLGRVLRPKQDGRTARLVVLYARGTIEDPTVQGENPLSKVLPHSRHSAYFRLPAEAGELLRFLDR
jgi:RNA polymerase primary sigma factor